MDLHEKRYSLMSGKRSITSCAVEDVRCCTDYTRMARQSSDAGEMGAYECPSGISSATVRTSGSMTLLRELPSCGRKMPEDRHVLFPLPIIRRLLILVLLSASPCFATNWYADRAALGSNNGTSW